MWSRDHMYLCIKKEFKDYSVLFLNQIRSARKTIAAFVRLYTFQDVTSKISVTSSLSYHHTSDTVSADPSMSFCPRYSDNG